MAAVPLLPSLVALIVAEPAATPVTNPLGLTVATAVLLLAHVIVRPVSTAPVESFVVALSCVVAPTKTLAVGGLTVTDATGTFDTVTAAVALFPSLVAVIVAEPAALAVTSPLPLTVATAALLVAQVMVRPVRTVPAASFVVALSCVVAPTRSPAVAGLRVTEATGTLDTVTVAVAVFPSLVAVIVTDPVVTPLASPVPLTVATAVLLLAQVIARPVRTFPPESFVVAESCVVPPTSRLTVAGLTVTDATGTVATLTAAVPLIPSLVAVMVAAPAASVVTNPLALTVAIAGLLVAQLTTRPVSTPPVESCGVAASCIVAPTRRLADAGVTATKATGTGGGGVGDSTVTSAESFLLPLAA